jgi:hypothetical protein
MTRAWPSALLFLALACAHAQSQPASTPETSSLAMLPLPRSSLAAVIAHRGDLDLTAEQVDRLQKRDEELEREQATLRAALEHRQHESPPQTGQQPATGMGGGPGGRHRNQARTNTATDAKPTVRSLEDQLDDADTRAYLAAEEACLTDKQRDPAREIAEKYREDLYDQRERAKQQKQ